MRISSVTATTCVVPLPRPIVMGEIRFDAREYIVVEIAADTGLTESTVNTYLKRIFSKLGVHSRVELIARMAGTATIPPRANYEAPLPD